MARLTGQAAADWIEANPGAAYETINPETNRALSYKGGSSGWLGDLIGRIGAGVLDPITGTGEQINQAFNQGQQGQDYAPSFLTENQWDEYVQNPLGKNLQNFASIGSYAVPGGGFVGGGLKGLIAGGALSGGLSGFAGQDLREGLDLGEIAGGAALGGAAGGVLGLAGKGIQKLAGRTSIDETIAKQIGGQFDSTADELLGLEKALSGKLPDETFAQRLTSSGEKNIARGQGFTAQTDKSGSGLDFTGSFNEVVKTKNGLLDFFGKPNTKEGVSSLAPELSKLKNAAIESDTTIAASLQKSFGNAESTALNVGGKGATAQQVQNQIIKRVKQVRPDLVENLDDVLTGKMTLDARDIETLKQATFNGYQKAQKGSTQFTNVVDEELYRFAKGINDDISGVRDINKSFGMLFGQNSDLVRAFNTGSVGGQTASLNPAQIAIGVARSKGGQAQKGLGQALQGQFPKLPGAGALGAGAQKVAQTPLMQALAQAAQDPIAQRALILGALGQGGGQDLDGGEQQGQEGGGFGSGQEGGLTQQDAALAGLVNKYQEIETRRSQLFSSLLSQGWKTTDATRIMNATIPKPPALPVATQAKIQTLSQTEGVLRSLEQGITEIGLTDSGPFSRIGGTLRGISGSIGLDPAVSAYQAQASARAVNLVRALGNVGAVSDSDRDLAERSVPTVTDTLEEAQRKIASLRRIFSDAKNSVIRETQLGQTQTGVYDDLVQQLAGSL